MTASPSPQDQGALIARRYVVQRKLGSGSMGTVYLARDLIAERLVALKILRLERLTSDAVARLQDEFRAIASLRHSQIAAAYDFGYTEKGGIPFYTREYIEGAPLPPGPPGSDSPSPAEFLQPVLDLLDALDYVHQRGILHLDIHAGNCIVSDDERRGSVLIDFGLVGAIKTSISRNSPREASMLPPEILERNRLTAMTDLYLVGRLLQYRLTGRIEEEPELPREIPGWGIRSTLDLERLTAKALRPSPDQRFQSAAEFREALYAILGERETRKPSIEPHNVTLGRDRELLEVERVIARAGDGKASCLRIVGKPGSGKSRLLTDARMSAQLRGVPTIEVGFFPDSGPEPTLLKALRRTRTEGRGGPSWLEALAPHHGGTPQERAQRAAEAFVAEKRGSLVLLLDDLDAADRESHLLAEALWAECLRLEPQGVVGSALGVIVTSTQAPSPTISKRHVSHLKPLRAPDARRLFLAFLKPLSPPPAFVRSALAEARGLPLNLRQIARAALEEWGPAGPIPSGSPLPAFVRLSPRWVCYHDRLGFHDRHVLKALAVLGRAASKEEIAVALELEPADVARSLRRLVRSEVVLGHGRPRRYQVTQRGDAQELLESVSRSEARRLHGRVAQFLSTPQRSTPRDHENLARHLLFSGRRRLGRAAAVHAARLLSRSGSFDRAVSLLEDFAHGETAVSKRLELVDAISSILEETGDHQKGIAVMEPVFRDCRQRMSRRQRVRMGRRLGIHLHRAGYADKALEVFEETLRRADPTRDLEELVFIDTELAELYLFQGSFDAAEDACQRGLERISVHGVKDEFRRRMEVMLRASLGHIELRRLSPARAQEELQAALKLSRKFGTAAERAAILHNLGATANLLNDLAGAKRYFRQAEHVLLKAGHRRDVIKICTNLAVIAAKLGDREDALEHVERAFQLARIYRGQQLEFFARYSRGIVFLTLGEAESAARAFESALPQGRKLDDHYLVRFGEVYLAEAYLCCGRYVDALRQLRSTARNAQKCGPPVLSRMVHSRLYLVETLLGRKHFARRSLETLDRTERTPVVLLEAWNDLYLGFGDLLSVGGGIERCAQAEAVFRQLKVPFAARCARLALLLESLNRREGDGVVECLQAFKEARHVPHPFLDVAEALVSAEAYFFLGQLEAAESSLARAADAIVGSPYLELDWRIECLRARIALKKKDLKEARRHLHRSLHARDHMLQLVPARTRKRFLAHPRFDALREVADRLQRSPRIAISTESLWRSGGYEGLIGQSTGMIRVFQTIEQARDQEIPVLITGETGTGKELVARAIYSRSPRSRGPFQALHGASVPEELFESELFGYQAGAFTGAEEDHAGLLEQLNGGTLLLDEVGEIPQRAQAKILRVLDSGVIRRLGSVQSREIDVRFLFTSTRDIQEAVNEGVFRRDLYYRLRGLEIRIPPLQERRADVQLLARHFLEKHAGRLDRPVPAIGRDALRVLEEHSWPGNVRELESLLLRVLVTLSAGQDLRAADLEEIGRKLPDQVGRGLLHQSLEDWRADLDRRYLTELFLDVRGNVKEMIERLGIRRTTLYLWFKKLSIDIKELRRRL